jgi:hypothetical protein
LAVDLPNLAIGFLGLLFKQVLGFLGLLCEQVLGLLESPLAFLEAAIAFLGLMLQECFGFFLGLGEFAEDAPDVVCGGGHGCGRTGGGFFKNSA